MATYTVPQVLINQLISEVSLNTVANQNVLVIGPNYELYRFDDTNTKSKIYAGRYDGKIVITDDENDASTVTSYGSGSIDTSRFLHGNLVGRKVLPYPGGVKDLVPDKNYTKVFLDEAIIDLLGEDSVEADVEHSDGLSGRLVLAVSVAGRFRGKTAVIDGSGDNILVDDNSNDRETAIPRDIVPGDVVIFKNGNEVTTSTIVSVDSSAPKSGVKNVLQLADSFTILEGTTVSFGTRMNDVEVPRKSATPHVYNWDTYHDVVNGVYGVVLASDMRISYNNWGKTVEEHPVVSAKVYVEHRDLVTSTSVIDSIDHHTKVSSVLGEVHPDNPLAYGVYMAALNSGDRLVYYCGVTSDDLEGYNEALGKATLTDQVYVICPTTMDKSVIDSVKAHVETMSSASNKLWRISVVSQAAPEQIPVLGGEATESTYYAKLVKLDNVENIGIQLMSEKTGDSVNTSASLRTMVQVGDVVRFYHGNTADSWDDTPGYTERTVVKVVSNSVLKLSARIAEGSDGIATSTSPDQHYEIEVYRPLVGQERVKYLASMSSAMASRRMYNVFPHFGVTNGIEYSGAFLACAVGGLVSSVLPQQPVTNVELNGIDGIPSVYTTYKKADLDTIAAGGTFILMQERPGAKVYVRHQISTEYTSSNLMKAELSITKNLDSISYYFAEIFAPLIGKYTITPELIEVIRSKLETGLSALESGTGAGLYGPQVLVDGTEIVELRKSDVNKDHVYAKVKLNLPVPFNYFDLDLVI